MLALALRLSLALTWLGLVLPVSANEVISRPIPEDGGPTKVEIGMVVADLDGINDADQNFTVNLFILVRWHDPREAHNSPGRVVKEPSELWHPNLVFINKQKTWSTMEPRMEVEPDGTVTSRQQIWGDFSQPLNLHDFPFDTQDFELRIVPVGPEQFGELQFVPHSNLKSFIVDNYSVADWDVISTSTDTTPYSLPGENKVESFAFIITAKRESGHYLIKIIAPLLMIVVLSWVVFWLDPKEGGSQLGVAVTAFLTVIAYHVAMGSKLPRIPYLTRLDVFVFATTILVFLAMIEVVITTGLARADHLKAARWTDRVCRVAFPAAMALVTMYAFFWH